MPELFTTAAAPPAWRDEPTLARLCECARLTKHQAEAVRTAAQGRQYEDLARQLQVNGSTARQLVSSALHELQHSLELPDGQVQAPTGLVSYRPHSGSALQPLVGVLPYVDAEKLATERDPEKLKRYYQTTQLRDPLGPTLVSGPRANWSDDPLTRLRWLVEHVRECPVLLARL